MRIVNKADIKEPLRNPLGEVIYEMIGAPEELGGTEKHSFVVVEVPPGASSSRHYHHLSEETYYVLKGMAKIVIDGEEFQLTPGDAVLIQPPEKHQIFNIGGGILEFITVSAPPWVPEDSVFL
jgi:mannose-1-phosphate guanylyltransferase/mannose-6-phosphate isomerase